VSVSVHVPCFYAVLSPLGCDDCARTQGTNAIVHDSPQCTDRTQSLHNSSQSHRTVNHSTCTQTCALAQIAMENAEKALEQVVKRVRPERYSESACVLPVLILLTAKTKTTSCGMTTGARRRHCFVWSPPSLTCSAGG
jgi:hypothetical protein